MTTFHPSFGHRRICVIGAGPCGLTALKNVLQVGCHSVVCYEENSGIGGNWAYTDDPHRISVHECSHVISSRRMSSFDDFPMPKDYPDFPSHRQVLAYFTDYARAFQLAPHIRLGSHVERCTLDGDGRWTVRVIANGETREERFDSLLVCSGHHREPFVPPYPGTFTGKIIHSSTYKRPDPFRGQRVLVVGAGNSAIDIAVDVARLASRAALSLREGTYFFPKLMLGQPIDILYAFWKDKIPPPLLQSALKLWLRLAIGRWEDYGLQTPTYPPLEKHPTVNSSVLEALRQGRLVARRGIERFDGQSVHFTDGTREEFDAIILGTGFRTSFPFLSKQVVDWDMAKPPPFYLRMMHPTIPSLFFIGLFQSVGCIWRLADYQARIAALQISGRLKRPADIATRIRHEVAHPRYRFDPSPRHAMEVDYHAFRRELMRELAPAGVADRRRPEDPRGSTTRPFCRPREVIRAVDDRFADRPQAAYRGSQKVTK
jgi:cation diffusion facilitator CzcD-associated flavoprotein CzcO